MNLLLTDFVLFTVFFFIYIYIYILESSGRAAGGLDSTREADGAKIFLLCITGAFTKFAIFENRIFF